MQGLSQIWLNKLQATANEDKEFQLGSEWLDLRLLVRIGASSWWFKVYRGRIIDAMPYSLASNRLGYDVVLSGTIDAWDRIVTGKSLFGREQRMNQLQIDGRRMDGDSSYRALVALSDRVLKSCGLPPEGV
jgi:hypothetical protein